MRNATLGSSGVRVSVLGLGCGNFGGVGSAPELFGRGDDEPAAFTLLDCAVEHGMSLLDTANSYGGGRSEEIVGRWLRSRGTRDDVVLTTKVRNRVGPRPEDEGLSARHITEQVDRSLTRLQVEHIDLYLAHEPDPATPMEETIEAFDGLVRAGKIGHYGLSNYSGSQLMNALAAAAGMSRPANLQNSYSLLDGDEDDLTNCVNLGVGFTAFSPLAGGWLTGKYRAGEPFPAGSRMTLRPEPYAALQSPDTFAAIDALAQHAIARGLDLATLALAWVLTDPRVSAAIVGPRTPAQLVQMLAALSVTLSPADRADLSAIARHRT